MLAQLGDRDVVLAIQPAGQVVLAGMAVGVEAPRMSRADHERVVDDGVSEIEVEVRALAGEHAGAAGHTAPHDPLGTTGRHGHDRRRRHVVGREHVDPLHDEQR